MAISQAVFRNMPVVGREPLLQQGGKLFFWPAGFPLLLSGLMVPCQKAREAQGFTSSCISWGLYHIKVERPYSMAHFRFNHPVPPPSVCRFNLLGMILVLSPEPRWSRALCHSYVYWLWFEFPALARALSSVDLPVLVNGTAWWSN